MKIQIQIIWWLYLYIAISITTFIIRFYGFERFHWPFDIFANLALFAWVKYSIGSIVSLKVVKYYFIFITLGMVFVSFFPIQTPFLIGVIFYLLSRITFNFFLEKVVSEKKFSSLKYNIILVISLILVLILTYSLVGIYLPLNFCIFVILFSFVHGLNLNYLFYFEESSFRFPIIASAFLLGFHDLIGAINFFYKIIDYNFLVDNVLLVLGNFCFALAVINFNVENKAESFKSIL